MYTNALDILLDLSVAINQEGIDDNEKAVKALELRIAELLPATSRELAEATLMPIGVAQDKLAELQRRKESYLALAVSRSEFIADGKHGSIIFNNEIIPVDLNLDTQKDLDWAIANEKKVLSNIAETFLANNPIDYFEGHITLFSEWGFSGEMKRVTAYRKQDAGKISLTSLFKTGGVRKQTRSKR